MAISASMVWEVRPTNGSDTGNSGGFKQGASGTDYSQQSSPQYSLTGLTTSGASATIASTSAAADMVGNTLRVTGGTNFTTGVYEIISVVVGVSITVDRNAASGVGATGTAVIGGAIKTLGEANTRMVAGNLAWVKAESTITTASQITINFANTGTGQMQGVIGYTTTRADNGKVTIQASGSLGGSDMVNLNAVGLSFANFVVDGNSQTSTRGIITNARCVMINVDVKNCTNGHGMFVGNKGIIIKCTATNCTDTSAFLYINGCTFIDCVAYSNTVSGFSSSGNGDVIFVRCMAVNNSGGSSDGFSMDPSQGSATVLNCVAYNNGRDGFHFSESGNQFVQWIANSISYSNARYGIFANATPLTGLVLGDYNAFGNNTTANTISYSGGGHDVTLTANPFTNAGSNDFSLNSTAGGGAACKAAGFPGAFAAGGTGYLDIGTLQHQDAGGGLKLYTHMGGGF